MRKLILAVAGIAAVAVPTIAPALASASVDRYQTQTATLHVIQPKDTVGQYDDVWKRDFKITINPCNNTFTGTDHATGSNSDIAWDEDVTGSIGDGTISFNLTPTTPGYTFQASNLPYDVSTPVSTNWTNNEVTMIASKPVITSTSNYKNHGDYVSSQGGGSDAAHSCIGMPITH
jgi:hypothetical protein